MEEETLFQVDMKMVENWIGGLFSKLLLLLLLLLLFTAISNVYAWIFNGLHEWDISKLALLSTQKFLYFFSHSQYPQFIH